MIQITYQPAFDALHAAFRLLRLKGPLTVANGLHVDHIRIVDFYLTFPHRLIDMKFIKGHTWIRKVARSYSDARPYGEAPDDRTLLDRMRPFQLAGLETLLGKSFFSQSSPQSRIIFANKETELPAELAERIDRKNLKDSDLIKALAALASEYEFFGKNGLKDRSGLMDYRHDAISTDVDCPTTCCHSRFEGSL